MRLPDGSADIAGRGLFEEKSHGSRADRVVDVGIIIMRRKNQDFDVRLHFDQLPGSFQAIEAGHGDIHEDDIGAEFLRHGDRLTSILRFADNYKAGIELQHSAKALPDNGVIFSQQNFDRAHE